MCRVCTEGLEGRARGRRPRGCCAAPRKAARRGWQRLPPAALSETRRTEETPAASLARRPQSLDVMASWFLWSMPRSLPFLRQLGSPRTPRRPVSSVGVLEGSTELQAVLYSPDYGEDQDRARTETRTWTRPRTRPGPGPGPGPRTGTRARTRTRTTAGPDPRPGSDRPGPEPRWNPNF